MYSHDHHFIYTSHTYTFSAHSSSSSSFQTTHRSSPFLVSLSTTPGSPLASTHILARPAASASNFPARRMFISATNTLRKSGFSRGSRCFITPGPGTTCGRLWPTVRLLLGFPSGDSHIGGAEALAVRTVAGMQLCRGIFLGGEGDRDFGLCFDFRIGGLGDDNGRREGRSSCQMWSWAGESGGIGRV